MLGHLSCFVDTHGAGFSIELDDVCDAGPNDGMLFNDPAKEFTPPKKYLRARFEAVLRCCAIKLQLKMAW